MGSHFISIGEKIPEDQQTPWVGETYGFWVSPDPYVRWFTACGAMIDRTPSAPDWLRSVRAEWAMHLEAEAGSGVGGGGLEAARQYPDGRRVLFEIAVATLEKLLDAGGDLYKAFPEVQLKETDPQRSFSLRFSDKLGLLEVGANFLRLVLGGGFQREHFVGGFSGESFPPMKYGYAPDLGWLK